MTPVRALVEFIAALKGTLTVALSRVRPRTLVAGSGLALAVLVLGAVQIVGGDPDGPAGSGDLTGDVPAAAGQLPPPGDGPVPGDEGRPLVAGLSEAPAPPRSGGSDANGSAGTGVAVGAGTGDTVPAGTGDMVGTGSGDLDAGAGSGGTGSTVVPPSTTAPPGTDTTTPPGTTATTATTAPDPSGSGGGLQALLALLGLD